ncbi:DNA-directed RNA polymerase specialized sigma subunit [Secundilactobacillus pentosiphilus]|uniref:DNA-directed RNA polymerase specialized sigma subunit n=1 Tax=Secundilactobacillus pentosiphilus TaxID=1714682 RepID=A0A1Z5INP3_9LACO|nr:sigma factor [Secundilactobacillus pentosiphilus]GAX03258.1 DNA-directed RNA polymerase specialized sigma subunit [Secundilactobacillus pentosiphilus]
MLISNEADWTLVEQARSGNESALIELLDRYRPLILSIQQRFYIQELELSEWLQESRIILWEVVNRFDVTRTHAFGSYLKTALLNCRRDYARRLNAKKRKAPGPVSSIDANPTFFADTLADERLFSSESLVIFQQRLLETVKKDLSKMERSVLIALVSGETEEVICERFGIDHIQFHNANERIKRKIRRRK